MKCEECEEKKAEFECPQCGISVCKDCMMIEGGNCENCAPHFVEIKRKSNKK